MRWVALICMVGLSVASHAQAQSPQPTTPQGWEQKRDVLWTETGRLYRSGQYEQGIEVANQALVLVETNAGPNHPDTGTSLNKLALLYRSMGQFDKALPLYQRALAIRENALGADHPNTATSLNNLAVLYRSMGQFDKALPLHQHALAIREKALGADTLALQDLVKMELRLSKYDLMTLSACDSASGGAGIESLAGLLQQHGAKAVLATLWSVQDEGTAKLMVEFYRQRGQQRQRTKAQALQQAQLALLRGEIKSKDPKLDLRHPYFWAPFVLMGNWM